VPGRGGTVRAAEHCPGGPDRRPPADPGGAGEDPAARLAGAPRVTLRRAVSLAAASASSEPEFFARLAEAGILVRTRFSTRTPCEVTGYAVALPADTAPGGPVWFGGGKLAADLTLPRLRSRWQPARTAPSGPFTPFTPQERNAVWEHAARTAADASAHIRAAASQDDAADAAWAAADTLRVAASALGSRELHRAAAAYDRAARCPYGRIPRATPAGNGLRQAARLLSALSYIGDPGLAQLALVARLAALIEDITDLRRSPAPRGAGSRRAPGRRALARRPDRLRHPSTGQPAPRSHSSGPGTARLPDAAGPAPARSQPATSHAQARTARTRPSSGPRPAKPCGPAR